MSESGETHDARVLRAFRRAAGLPWYRTLLDEAGVRPSEIDDVASFARRCPVLSKSNTFDRFPLHELSPVLAIPDLAGVLTSSGHGGRFSFGLISRQDADAGAGFIDYALDGAFAVASRRTLAINCLPMGVTFSSRAMTVATVSVREDMAVALIRAFGVYYEQILLVMDPLFAKRLTDYAAAEGLDWSRYRVQVVIGEEVFGEHFRDYLAARLGLHVEQPERGYIMSSFGVGELGLHLCFETPATIALRRTLRREPAVATEVLGSSCADGVVPAILSYHARRTFIENVDADANGFGRMTISMLDPELPVSLLRYQTGDVIRMLDRQTVEASLRRHGVAAIPALPDTLIALQGREKERLPNGSHVAVYKDALYADETVARAVTGAVRLTFAEGECTVHVQLVPDATGADAIAHLLAARLAPGAGPVKVVCWPYAQFPFGMTLDYERKFRQYVPGQPL